MFTLNDTSLPSDIKSLRTSLLSVRNLLDVFVFAYNPFNDKTDKHDDIFTVARADMNEGYTWIGNFKDLDDSHVNYTYAQMVALRVKCLKWQEKYYKHAKKYNYSEYIVTPSTDKLYERSTKELSPFFWGAVDGLRPSLTRGGYENIAYLMESLTSLALKNYVEWLNLTQIYGDATQLVFHAYRKLIRGVNSVSDFASEIYIANATCVKGSLSTTNSFFGLIGKVHDQITAYDYYMSNNETTLAAQEIVTIDQMWGSLQQWATTQRPDESLLCLLENLIPITEQ